MANPKDEHEIPKAAGHPMASGQRGLATSTDPNNAARLAKVPYGTGGNPGAMKPDAPAQPVATGPAASPAESKPNSFGDAAAAANSSAVTQVGVPKPSAPAARQSYDAGFLNSHANPLVNQIPVDAGRGGPASDGSANSMMNTDLGRTVTNTLSSLPGAAAVPGAAARAGAAFSGALGGAAPAASMVGRAAQTVWPVVPPAALAGVAMAGQSEGGSSASAPSATSALTTAPSATYESQGLMGPPDSAAMREPAMLGATQVPAQAQQNYNRTGMTNAQVAEANPVGRVTMTRQANGTMAFSGGDVSGPVSYMDGGGNPLAGGGVRGNGFSRVDSTPAGGNVAMGPNGSFAYASGNPLANGAGQSAPATSAGYSGQQQGASAASALSNGVDSALADAAQRGDFDAVRSHYAGRGQGFGAQGAAQAPQGFSGEIGQSNSNGNAWGRTPEQQRRDAETQASSIHKPTAAIGNAALKGLDARNLAAERNQADLTREQMRIAGEQSREAMRQQGENFRSSDRNRLVAAEMGLRGREWDSRSKLTDMEVAKAQRNASIVQRYDSAKDDAERAEIRRQNPDVFGMTTADPVGKDRFMTVGGGTSVVDGQTVRDPVRIFDTVTQQEVGGAGQGKQSIESNPQAIAIRDNPKLSWEQKAAELKKLGY